MRCNLTPWSDFLKTSLCLWCKSVVSPAPLVQLLLLLLGCLGLPPCLFSKAWIPVSIGIPWQLKGVHLLLLIFS